MATPEQQQIIALTTMMFNAPPGATFLAEFEGYLNQGLSLEQVAINLANTDTFNAQFEGMTTDKEKIDLILSAVGIDEQGEAYEEAFSFFQESLDNGIPPGLALQEAANFLSTTEDESFSQSSAMFRNKVETGVIHSVELGLSSENLEELKTAIANVTSDPQSVASAAQALNQQAEEEQEEGTGGSGGGGGGGVSTPSFTLAAAVTADDGTGLPTTYNISDITDSVPGPLSVQKALIITEAANYDNETYNIADTADVIANAAMDATVTGAADVTTNTALLDVTQAQALEGITNLNAASEYTLGGGAVAIADALVNEANAFENATSITTNDQAAVDLTVEQAAALQTANATIAASGYNIEDGAATLLALGSAEPITSATAVTVTGGAAGALTIQEHSDLSTLTTNDTWTYSIEAGAAELLAVGESEPITSATAVAVIAGAAGTLSFQQHADLTNLTTDDTWTYSIEGTLDAILSENAGGRTVLAGANTITAQDVDDGKALTLTGLTETSAGTAVDFTDDMVTLTQAQLVEISNAVDVSDADALTVTGVTVTDGDFTEAAAIDLLEANDTITFEGNAAELDLVNFDVVFGTNGAGVNSTAGDAIRVNGTDGDDIIDASGQAANFILNGGNGANTLTGGAGVDTFVFEGTDSGSIITGFQAGADGDLLDLNESLVAINGTGANYQAGGGGVLGTSIEFDTDTGLFVYTDNDLTGTTVSDIENLFDGTVDNLQLDSANGDTLYLAASDGNNSYIFLIDDTNANGGFTDPADTATLIATLEGVDDASTLTADNFVDFA